MTRERTWYLDGAPMSHYDFYEKDAGAIGIRFYKSGVTGAVNSLDDLKLHLMYRLRELL